MNNNIFIVLFLYSFSSLVMAKHDHEMVLARPVITQNVGQDCAVADDIACVIYGPERTRIICKSEVERLSIDGRSRTVQDLAIEELIFQEGLKFKVQVDELVIDRYIMGLRKQYKLKLDDLIAIFDRSGYTYDEARNEFRMMYVVNGVIEQVINARLMVPREDVIRYYQENPILKEARYELQMAFVPFDTTMNQDQQFKKLTQDIIHGKAQQLLWRESFWLKQSDLSEHINFITSMDVGAVPKPIKVVTGFEVYKLVAKKTQHLVPLEKRYREIEATLRQPEFDKKFEEYKKALFDFATIVYYQ